MVGRRASRWGAVLATATLMTVAGCELGTTILTRTDPFIVIHAVLNASATTQFVLVEQSLSGAVNVTDSGHYDPADPIGTGSGIPIGGATVTITGPGGQVLVGNEFKPTGKTTGIYRVTTSTSATSIKPGQRYTLSVTAAGQVVSGSTIVPDAPKFVGVSTVMFNRDHDTLSAVVSDAVVARGVWLRIDAPLAAYEILSMDRHLRVNGGARNIFTDDLIRVFYPGFRQTVTVAVVDTNLYDYYRSGNDPFSGTGLINHLIGGLGIFGSMVVVDQRILDVSADPADDPIEGRYTLRNDPGKIVTDKASEMTLYLEAASNSSDSPDRLSGSHLRGDQKTRAAVYGTRTGTAIRLQLLMDQSTAFSNATFRGIVRGDSLIGSIDGVALTLTYVKAGK